MKTKYLNKRSLKKLVKQNKIIVESLSNIYVEKTVTFGQNVKLMPFVVLSGKTHIDDESRIESFTTVANTTIGKNCKVSNSVIIDSKIGSNNCIGPFAYIRENTQIENGCRVGDFVELKNSQIGDSVKIAHLAYVGDATLGKKVNIGCGVVFANFNGKIKQRIEVGDNAFIGSNVNLVAPLTVGEGCFIACGSTVTKDLERDSFAIERSQMYIKANGAKKYLGSER